MKFKLDENFGARTQHIFEKAEHDVQTVRQELLQGASDQCIYEVCCKERRCLVTLDLDFSEVTRFPPRNQSNALGGRIVDNRDWTNKGISKGYRLTVTKKYGKH